MPLIIALPLFMGIDGIMYAGPIADFMAWLTSTAMAAYELHHSIYNEKAV